jgi:hypothetical protein
LWGGIMTEVAAVRGVAGTVINGVCRDVSASLSQHYPLFSRGRVMRTGKDRSMVDLSDHGNLLERFVALPLPRMFMYGHQNNSLPYVTRLAENGIELAEISHIAHVPMYSNAPEMWSRITDFVVRSSKGDDHRDAMS